MSEDLKVVVPSKMRRVVAHITSESFSKVPHYHVTVEFDAGAAFSLSQRSGVKPVDVILYHVARLLREYELLNGYWEEDTIYLYGEINIGYVVAVDDGMLIPVIRKADELALPEIHIKRRDLVTRALTHKLLPEEYKGGTFTVSNLGVFPVDSFTGVIYKNQSGLLTLGRLSPDKLGKISLVCDHRLIDGYYAAKFLSELKSRLEGEMM